MAWPEFLFIFVMPDHGDLSKSESCLFATFMQNQQWVEAVKFYEAILRMIDNYPPALNALAMVAYENQDYETAFRLLGSLAKKFPGNPVWLNNLALALVARGDLEAGRAALQKALQISPKQGAILYNRACFSVSKGDLPTALSLFRQLIDDQSCQDRALFAVSRIAKELGLIDEAIESCRRLISLFPDNAEFYQNLGLLLLKKGEWEVGLKLYEARWQANNLQMLSSESLWLGQEFPGQRLLVWAEQGFGDTINFACFLPLFLQHYQCGVVVVAVQTPLLQLFQHSFPEFEIMDLRGIDNVDYDFQIPLLSLPRIFQARPEMLPASTIPYLTVAKSISDRWQNRLQERGFRFRVGVVWRSNPINVKEVRRSIPLAIFGRLFSCENAVFYSLQKEMASSDIELLETLFSGNSENFFELSAEINDFQDTAAILQNLDLLISVDTSVPHLAGALACPTWLLLPFDADWRWLLERNDSPWYPTMRLFRQPQPGDWESVLDQVCYGLQKVVRGEEMLS